MRISLIDLWLGRSLVCCSAADIKVYFSPKGGRTEAVVETLDKATSSVLVRAYFFPSAPIAKALVDAEKLPAQFGTPPTKKIEK